MSRRNVRKFRQRGAVSLVLLTALPLLLAAAAVVAGTLIVTRAQQRALHTCRVNLLRIEDERLARLKTLIALNPKASRLRLARAKAERAVTVARMSGSPKAIAAAEAARAVVVTRQIQLATEQTGLIRKADMGVRIGLRKLSHRLRIEAERDPSATSGALKVTRLELKPLGVRAVPAASLTPDYETVADLESRHRLSLVWQLSIDHALVRSFRFGQNLDNRILIRGQCASTARPKGKLKWQSRLDADKSSSSFW